MFGKIFLILEFGPFALFLILAFFGQVQARYAFSIGFTWLVGMGFGAMWLLENGYHLYSFLALLSMFMAHWMGVLIGTIISPTVPFEQTPAGVTKRTYDDLPEEQKETVRKVGRFGLKIGMEYLAGRFTAKGYTNLADVTNKTRRLI